MTGVRKSTSTGRAASVAEQVAAARPTPQSALAICRVARPDGPCVTNGCVAAATGKARRCDEHFVAVVERLGI